MHKTCRYAVSAVILSVLVNACVTYAYAQLADTMLCADKGCSETISEGKARLAYRPRDDKFLNLEKGDVVLVKSKNAGKKSHLWGGQGFMKGVNGHKSPDLYAGLIGENQRITVDKSRKKKTAKEEDPKKKDEATQTENMQSSEEMGPSGLKSDMADEGSAPTVSPNLGNHDAASKQNQPAPQVSSDAPVDESAAQDKIVEAQNNDRSHHTATPLPPTIAAIMEEKLKSSLNTDDTYETKTQPNPDTKETSSLPNVINPGLDEDSHKLREDAYEHPNKDGFQPNSRDSGQLDVNHETKPLPETNDHLDGSERENPTETNDGERNTNDIAVSGTQIVQTDETHDAKEPLLEDQSRETVLSSDAKAGDTQKTHDDTRIHEKENADDKSGSDTHPLQPDEILKTDNAMPQNINGNTLTSATPELENTDQTNNQLHEQQKEDNTTGGNAQTVRLNDTRDDKESVHHNTPGNDAVSSAKEAIHSEVALETKEKLHQVAINNENSQNEREADEQKGATTQDSDKTFPKSSETAHSYDGRNKEYDRDLDEETAREDVLGVTGQHANVPTDDDDNDEPFEDDIDDDFEVEYLSQQPQPNDKEVVNTDNKKTGANIAQAKDVQDFKPHEQPIASQFEKSVSNSSEVSENSLSDSILDKDNDSTDLEKRTVEHTDLSEKPTMSLDKSQQAEDKSDSTEKSTTHDKKAEGFGVPAPALIKEESQEDAVAGELDIQSNEPSEILHSTLSDGTGVPPQNAQPEDVNLDLDLNSSSNHLVSADSNDQSLPIKEQEASQSEVEDDLASSTPKEAKTETSIPGQESHTEKAITDSKFSHTGSALSGSEEDPTSDDASKYDEKSSSDKDSTIKSTDSSQSEVEDDLASSTPEEEKTETSIPGQESHTEEAVTDSKFSQTGSALSGSKEDPISEDVSKNDEKSSTDKDSTIKSTASSQNHITEKDSRDTDPKGDSEEQHGGNNIAESMNEDKEGNEQPNTSSEGLEASTLQQAQTYSDNEKSSARSDVSAPGVTDDSKVIVNQTEGSHSESMPDGGEEVEVKSEAFSVSPKGAHDEDFATDNQKARQDSNVGSTQSTVAFPDIPPPGPPPSQANLEHKLEVPEAVDGDSQHEVSVDDSSSAMQNQSGDAVDDSDDVESKTLPSESDQQSYLKPDDDKKSRDSTVPEAVEASSSADAMDRNPDKHDEEKRKIADQELSDDSKQDDRGTDGAIQSGGSPTNALDAANEEPKSTDDTQDKVSGKDPTDEVLQLDGMGKNMNEKSGESSNQEYTDEMESLNDPQTDKYKVLHEGKMVDWDETIQETPKGGRTPTWDEEIGHETDHVDPASAATDLDDSDAQRDSTTVVPEGYKSSAEENASPHVPVEGNLDEKDEDVPPSHDNSVDQQDEASQERVVTKPEDLNENVAGKKDISAESHDVASDDTTVPRRDLQFVREESTGETAESTKEIFDIEESKHDESKVQPAEHDDSFWIRLLIAVSNVPWDIVYVCEPLSEFWISLLPLEYQKDVFGVAWPVIFFTVFAGFALIFILVCRSRSAKTRRKNEFAQKTIDELRTQLDNLSKEKVDVENELRNKQNEVEIQNDQMMKSAEDKEGIVAEKTQLENSIQLYGTENENLKRHIQELTQAVQEKNLEMQQMINNCEQAQERLHSQEQIIESSNQEITKLQESVRQQENNKQEANSTIDKLKERLKNLEKTKGESKKEGKLLKDQINKLNGTIEDLQQKLDLELEDGEQRKQEIDVLKDCILQFKGAREIFGDEDEEGETEEVLEKQKEKMKEMVDVANIRKLLRQSEADKLQVTYELEAEKEKRTNKETKVTELEAVIQGDEVVRSKLQRDIQTLESKLSVMQDFYAKREVEIQSKLGLEKSRLESNTSLLEDKEKHQGELLDQLNMYKKMCEEAKQKYDQSERKHKQEVVGFEKRAHDNWLASREAERKFEEANKQISRLQMEMDDMKIRLRESERDMIIRPRPERHGPPGAPPPFGPPRRHMPPGSPLHFRSGPPPDADRRSPPHRRPPSPGGSIPGDRPPSRPDRPPSTHSLPPMDRRPPSGPPMGPGHPYGGTPGRPPFRDGPPSMRPPLRDVHHHGRPPSGPVLRPPSGPMTSSPYMERPPIPLSQSPRSQAFTQSSLHATPSHPPIEGLRTDGYKAPPRGPPPAAAPSNVGRNAYRRSKS